MTTKNDILVALAEAREDAREEALAEGSAAKQVEIARAMLAKNSSVEFIASVTGLTEEQVRNL